MFVCLCKGITDQQIADTVKNSKGVSCKDICQKLKVGSDCGCCLSEAQSLIEQLGHKQERESQVQQTSHS